MANKSINNKNLSNFIMTNYSKNDINFENSNKNGNMNRIEFYNNINKLDNKVVF
jgi:hypothetical protein